MKKLFVAILALGALASCQKENLPSYADTESKSIQIAILNEDYSTRAQGGTTAQGVNGEACAYADQLLVLFADASGNILYKDELTSTGKDDNSHGTILNPDDPNHYYVKDNTAADKYLWHNVPANVKKIAVVRVQTGDDVENGTPFNTLAQYVALAKNLNTNIARGLDTIILYGEDDLYDTGKTHAVGNAFYHVWQADVEVAPEFARFEINNIMCKDLGTLNADVDSEANGWDATTTYDLDELLLKSLKWTYTPTGGEQEEHSAPGFGDVRLYGEWNPTNGEDKEYTNTNTTKENRLNYYKLADQKFVGENDAESTRPGVWSWNVLPGSFNQLVLDIDAYAYAYIVPKVNLPLTVTGLATSKADADAGTVNGNAFQKGKIYTIDLTFNQENIKDEDGICVEVKVTIATWVVEPRYPIYGNN